MRVGFQIDQLWFTPPGGIGTYVRELGVALLSSGEVDVVPFRCSFGGDAADPGRLAELGAVEIGRGIRSVYPRWTLLGRPPLPSGLDDVDIVHATNPASVPPVREGQRLVVTVHDLAALHHPELFPIMWRRLYRAGLRASARRADAVLVPSTHTREDLIDSTSIRPDLVHVTPLAARAPSPEPPPEQAEGVSVPRPYVLSVGTQEPRKNLVRLVRAYRQVAPDVPHGLVLAGPTGWHDEALVAELERPGAGKIVRTGRLGAAELDLLYRGADAFAYVSTYEGFGLPVAEAMAYGLPVVASSTTSLPEVTGGAARLVDPRDVAGIAEALAAVLTEPGLASDLRARSLSRAADLTWEATASATLIAYHEAKENR